MLMHGEEMPMIILHNVRCIKGQIGADGRLAKRVWLREVEIRQGISRTAK